LLKPFVSRFLDILYKEVNGVKIGSHSDRVLLAHPLDVALEFLRVVWQNFYLYVVDGTIGVLLN